MAQYESSSLLIPFSILGILLAIGLIVGGLLLGTRIRDFKRADRYVEVKGLVERTGKYAPIARGRPAELFRFRREVVSERPAPGMRLGTRRSGV